MATTVTSIPIKDLATATISGVPGFAGPIPLWAVAAVGGIALVLLLG